MRAVLLSSVAVLALGGCTDGVRRAIGIDKIKPDEFEVVRRAPLEQPPEYGLRPPKPGEARPQELSPAQEAQAALFGSALDENATAETFFLDRAGARFADASIRGLIDAEAGAVMRKSPELVEMFLFGEAGDNALQDTATGGERPVIKKKRGVLPGVF